ncbi:hypothetical protein BD410DRAFT_623859 [Rickenella mellea]|uniref:Uncharacterized protein n=1 Tax=Rickenella mellea TaxID=50990 RepID=A0A4Y7PNI0_9AGAM|nr:hypothetical protein BD410DRAFT_623859 [Rickenella mellea]
MDRHRAPCANASSEPGLRRLALRSGGHGTKAANDTATDGAGWRTIGGSKRVTMLSLHHLHRHPSRTYACSCQAAIPCGMYRKYMRKTIDGDQKPCLDDETALLCQINNPQSIVGLPKPRFGPISHHSLAPLPPARRRARCTQARVLFDIIKFYFVPSCTYSTRELINSISVF